MFERYRRQINVHGIGEAGQKKLSDSTVVVCGCGALGTSQANLLARAGIGNLILVDRDFVDLSNLQRQSLFDEQDVSHHQPKAVAAAEKLRQINSEISIRAIVADIHHENIVQLIDDADVVLDGTDNFETRYLINDACCQTGKPWVFGGCLGVQGQSMTIVPGSTACFACLMPEPPAAGAVETCDTGGILASIIQTIAAIQFTECVKLLLGSPSVSQHLTVVDLWSGDFKKIDLTKLHQRGGCRVCRDQQFDWLGGRSGNQSKVLCGRNSVQIRPQQKTQLDLAQFAERLRPFGKVLANDYLVRLTIDQNSITLFPDGRAIITGTEDPTVARTLYSKFIGN